MEEFKKRVLANYNFSILKYKKIFKSYHWEYQNSSKQNLFTIQNLMDFRNNGLSRGLDDQYYSEKDTLDFFYSLKMELGEELIYKMLEDKNVGNVKNKHSYKNKIFSSNELFHIKFASMLKQNNAIKSNDIVCEIGAGYGSLINKLFKIINFKAIIIDLPEANFINSFFLKSLYPQKKFFLSSDIKKGEITTKDIYDNDIIILCPWDKIPQLKIDLFINTRSMMEMNYETIKFYFDLIHQKISKNGYFFCINRYYKDTVGYPVEFSKYPYDKKWKIVFSEPSWNQKHVHALLTQRIDLEQEDIKKELNIIQKLSNKAKNKDQRFIRRFLPNQIYKIYKLLKYNFLKK